ncbi:MAG: hypothetical protein GY750_20315 [Lentisphaerae bacterium]|nr:hypothetical protein [Lentisphaerota bacterium]MCP4103739.1 hypothetical protein [Lentisphaerota bacterium]
MDHNNPFSRGFSRAELCLLASALLVVAALILVLFHVLDIRKGVNKWMNFHLSLNQDSDLIINYDFENPGYRAKCKGLFVPSLCNIAGNAIKGDEMRLSDGILINSPQIKKNGRWPGKGTLRFDGQKTFVVSSGHPISDIWKTGISVMTWMRFNNLDKVQCLYGCASGLLSSKFNLYWRKRSFRSSLGGHEFSTPKLKLESGIWYHLALAVAPDGLVEFYLNGKQLPFKGENDKARLLKSTCDLVIGGLCLDNSDNGITTQTVYDEKRQHKITVECGLRDMFEGEIDEFMLYKRPLSEDDVITHYEAGNPY